MNTTYTAPTTTPEDMLKSRALTERFFSTAADLPISFVLDGKTISGIPDDWRPTLSRRRIDATIIERVFEGNHPGTGLHIRVECTEYLDYPVIEWVAWFTNQGSAPTPIISDIRGIDTTFSGASPVLYHCNGDFYSADGYTPQETPLHAGDALDFAPQGGRPCDRAFPYYRVTFKDWGLTLAIGWPAQWAARFSALADSVQIQAGQEKTNLRLLPGERIRTPRMTVLAWAGDGAKAVNLWRRWYLAHVLPRPNGEPMQPLLAGAATDDGEEFTAATEANQVRYIEKFVQQDIHPDVWWIDAGWYPCYNQDHVRKWTLTGTWKPDPERFPNGLKPVSDYAAQNGADLLIWFEPERVAQGTQLDFEHPEWLLRAAGSKNGLLNLGNPECRQWLTNHYSQLIKDNGIKIYRQDYNFEPLQHWRENEAEDRQGINENLHTQGYLQFWDDLLAQNPGLWIDSCASGGRRNDLETMRRSVPLHYSDYGYGDHPVKLAFHRTMYEWIPYFKDVTLSWDLTGKPTDFTGKDRFDDRADNYSYHCGMAPMFSVSLDIRRDDYDYASARAMIDIWRSASDLILYGDYYPHTPFHRDPHQWVSWQFDSPEKGCGLVQGIRLPAAPQTTLTIHPKVARPDAIYFFENTETGETREIPGGDLMSTGFTFALPARSGAIWFYRTNAA